MDRTDNQLRACVSALNDVIGPALDPGDAQAAEQLFLVTDYLGYLRSHLPYLLDHDRFELRHHLAMARALGDDADACSPEAGAQLREAIAAAEELRADPDARTPQLKAAAAALAAAITAVVRAAAGADEVVRTRVERLVVAMSEDKIEVDRAWHAPQGLEPEPATVLDLDQALGLTRA